MIKNILWDFDGVILDSMTIRDWGFREIFKSFDDDKVEALLDYHSSNGGLSRYVKIRYFYEKILRKSITDDQVQKLANEFSVLMKNELVNPENLINHSLNFIKKNYENYNFHIVSGSDEKELRFLCKELKINQYFISIHGSPTPKNQLVKDLLKSYDYKVKETCLIGDSINDYEAAIVNDIEFEAYNNSSLSEKNTNSFTFL